MAEGFVNQTAERIRARSAAAAQERAAAEAEDGPAMKALEERIAAARAGRAPESWAVKDDPKRLAEGGIIIGKAYTAEEAMRGIGWLGPRTVVSNARGGVETLVAPGENDRYWMIRDEGGYPLDLRTFTHDGDIVNINDELGIVRDAANGVIEKTAQMWRNNRYPYAVGGVLTPEQVDVAHRAMASMPTDQYIKPLFTVEIPPEDRVSGTITVRYDRTELIYKKEDTYGTAPSQVITPIVPKGQLPKELQ